MMKGSTPSSGAASGRMSGTSAPPQLFPFQKTKRRFGSHGLPVASAEARLYRIRRLAGQAQAQPGVFPSPLGSLESRRAI